MIKIDTIKLRYRGKSILFILWLFCVHLIGDNVTARQKVDLLQNGAESKENEKLAFKWHEVEKFRDFELSN